MVYLLTHKSRMNRKNSTPFDNSFKSHVSSVEEEEEQASKKEAHVEVKRIIQMKVNGIIKTTTIEDMATIIFSSKHKCLIYLEFSAFITKSMVIILMNVERNKEV